MSLKPEDETKLETKNNLGEKKDSKLHNAPMKIADQAGVANSIAIDNYQSGSNSEDEKAVPMQMFEKQQPILQHLKTEVKPRRTNRMSTGANSARIREMWRLEKEKEKAKEKAKKEGEGDPPVKRNRRCEEENEELKPE